MKVNIPAPWMLWDAQQPHPTLPSNSQKSEILRSLISGQFLDIRCIFNIKNPTETWNIQGSLYCQPNQCTFQGKSVQTTIHLHGLIPSNMGNLMTPDIPQNTIFFKGFPSQIDGFIGSVSYVPGESVTNFPEGAAFKGNKSSRHMSHKKKRLYFPLNPGCLKTGSLFHSSLRIQDYPEISWGWDWNP